MVRLMSLTVFEFAPPGVWIGLGWVIAFLGASSLFVSLHPRLRAHAKVRAAILSWWPVMFVASLAVLLGPAMTAVVLAMVSAALVREGIRLLALPEPQRRLHVWIGGAAAVLVHGLALVDGSLATTLGFAAALAVAPVLHLLVFGTDNFVRAAGGSLWVLAAAVGMFSFAARTALADPSAAFVFFLLVMMSDALQFLGGKLFGRRPLVPRVSPRKTWEGLLFGVFACATLGGQIAPVYLGLAPALGFALGAGLCVLGLLGDLVVSAWKRDAGVKDSGDVLPGQGGLLDRCDSLIFAAPWFYLLVTARIGAVP